MHRNYDIPSTDHLVAGLIPTSSATRWSDLTLLIAPDGQAGIKHPVKQMFNKKHYINVVISSFGMLILAYYKCTECACEVYGKALV